MFRVRAPAILGLGLFVRVSLNITVRISPTINRYH